MCVHLCHGGCFSSRELEFLFEGFSSRSPERLDSHLLPQFLRLARGLVEDVVGGVHPTDKLLASDCKDKKKQ